MAGGRPGRRACGGRRSDHDPYSREGGSGDEDGDRFDEGCEDESDDEESHRDDASPTAGFAPAETT
ncbi:hypothetical protein ASR50_22615 [Streptomyces sp. 4F]|nr:hypothetical protein ASR50_22615 [Streptomyces sp. 4F]